MAIRVGRDKNLLAYMGKDRKFVRVLTVTTSGAIAQCELVDSPGNIIIPLIKNGKNVEKFGVFNFEGGSNTKSCFDK